MKKNKVLKIIKNNFTIISLIIIFILVSLIIKKNYMSIVNDIDFKVHNFFTDKIINDPLTVFMKIVTLLGSTVFVISVYIVCLIVFKKENIKKTLATSLIFLLFLKSILKEVFKRPRPTYPLIKIPPEYSFPSGHTLFAMGFYGLIIYFIWKSNIDKHYKYILTSVISILIIFIGISRIYLGVHYFSDVIGGFILGILSVLLFVNIYSKSDWGEKV